jgi:hypothetical protein
MNRTEVNLQGAETTKQKTFNLIQIYMVSAGLTDLSSGKAA